MMIIQNWHTTRAEALRLQALDDLYMDALALIEAGDLNGALVVLEDIEAQEPYYRDVKNRILQIQDQTLLGDQLREADRAIRKRTMGSSRGILLQHVLAESRLPDGSC